MSRTLLKGLILSVAAGMLALAPAQAQKYPDKPVRIIVPLGPGGVGDISTRLLADRLGQKLNQRFYVENIPAAGGIQAAKTAISAPADGYTLILFTGGVASAVPQFNDLGYDPLKDFAPVSSMGFFDCLAVVNADSPYKTLEEFIKAAKDKPGTLNIGAISGAGVQPLAANYLKQASGAPVVIIPYKTTPDAVLSLMRNDVHMVVDFYAALKAGITDGKLRPVAWTGKTPAASLPDLKTAQQQGVKDFEANSWNSIYVKAGTPAEVITTINKAMHDVLNDAEVKQKMLDFGIEARPSSPQEMDAKMRNDIKVWTDVIAKAGIEKR